ncbi:MAG: hypothetical protein ACKOET_12190 [Verrucomicrobiota bacterium]
MKRIFGSGVVLLGLVLLAGGCLTRPQPRCCAAGPCCQSPRCCARASGGACCAQKMDNCCAKASGFCERRP